MILFGSCTCLLDPGPNGPFHLSLAQTLQVGASLTDYHTVRSSASPAINLSPGVPYGVDLRIGFSATTTRVYFLAGFEVVVCMEAATGSNLQYLPNRDDDFSAVGIDAERMRPSITSPLDSLPGTHDQALGQVYVGPPIGFTTGFNGTYASWQPMHRDQLIRASVHGQEYLVTPRTRLVFYQYPCASAETTTLLLQATAWSEDASFFSDYPNVTFGGTALLEIYPDPNAL